MYTTHYCPSSDMTFITKDTETKTVVIGFYFGEPDEELTADSIKKARLTAEYEVAQ